MPNLMGAFRDAGYRTASFGKRHYVAAESAFEAETGPVLSRHVGYYSYADQYDEAQYEVVKYPGDIYPWIFGGRFPAPAEETAEAEVLRCALHWLEDDTEEAPFFLRLSFNGPHTPVVPPPPFEQAVKAKDIDLPRETHSLPDDSPRWLFEELARCATADVLSAEQLAQMRRYYYGEAAFLDDLFGKLLGWMNGRGLLDNTIIAYCSDHGTHLGDYGLVQKQTFFEPAVRVPFLFSYPGHIPCGTRCRTPVETQSLLPTLLAFAGLEVGDDGCAPSLDACLRNGREPESRPVFSEFTLGSFAPNIEHRGRLVMVREDVWKLSACMDPEICDVALYNLRDDPYERVNRAADPDCRQQRVDLLGRIEAHLEAARAAS